MDSITGQCEYVIANLDTVKAIDKKTIRKHSNLISEAPLIVTDANLSQDSLVSLIELCCEHKKHLFIEPTDVMALPQLVGALNQMDLQQSHSLASIVCLTPNLVELNEMLRLFDGLERKSIGNNGNAKALNTANPFDGACTGDLSRVDRAKRAAQLLLTRHLRNVRSLLVTLDKDGILFAVRSITETDLFDANEFNLLLDTPTGNTSIVRDSVETTGERSSDIVFEHFPAPKIIDRPVSGSGAGDSFAAGFISGLLHNQPIAKCIAKGFEASLLALQSRDTIPKALRGLAICSDSTNHK